MITNLSDTRDLMISHDYKERFQAEYYQLVLRYRKLKDMLEKWDRHELDFIPKSKKRVLKAQLSVMEDYKGILEHRALGEGVDLHIPTEKEHIKNAAG